MFVGNMFSVCLWEVQQVGAFVLLEERVCDDFEERVCDDVEERVCDDFEEVAL